MPILLVDPSGRGPSLHALFARGLVVVAVLALVGVLAAMQSRGAFHESVPVTAWVNGVGDGLHVGADVKVRGVRVGSVREVRTERDGDRMRFEVELHIEPHYFDGIARSARARVVPSNVFGAPSIELVVSEGDHRQLAAGAVIPADDSAEGMMLQTAYGTLRDLLASVQPGKLNQVLTALAQSFEGRGDKVGRMIGKLDRYLTELNGHSGEFTQSLDSLATAMRGLQDNAPHLLDAVDSFLVTSQTLVEKEADLARFLDVSTDVLRRTEAAVRRHLQPVLRLLHNGARITEAVAPTASDLPRSFLALRDSLTRIARVLEQGLVISFVFVSEPFGTYTPRDCPRYPGLDGPNCGASR